MRSFDVVIGIRFQNKFVVKVELVHKNEFKNKKVVCNYSIVVLGGGLGARP